MSILAELAAMPGVICAGEYSYRGDRFTYKGQLTDKQARQASIMCRATSMSVHMQSEMLQDFCQDCGFHPHRGWIVRGPQYSVCVVANVFCFVQEGGGSINEIVAYMREQLASATDELI